VEHQGIYPESGQAASELTGWYNDLFGFDVDEGEGWYFVRSTGHKVHLLYQALL
jgi:hypothetical protein